MDLDLHPKINGLYKGEPVVLAIDYLAAIRGDADNVLEQTKSIYKQIRNSLSFSLI